MKTQSVYNMLAKADKAQKHEFGSMKVELSLMSDIDGMVKEAESIWKESSTKHAQAVKEMRNKVQAVNRNMVEHISLLYKTLQKADAAFDELGIDNSTKKAMLARLEDALAASRKRLDYLDEVMAATTAYY